MKNILKKLYFSPVGELLARVFYPVIRRIKSPMMLWGYLDSSGAWRQRTRISDTVFFYRKENIYIADNVFIGHYGILDGTGCLKIGAGTHVSAWVGIFTHSSHIAIRLYGDHYQEISENEKIGFCIKPVNIGKYVFIGAGARILPGVSIGDGALVASGSVVRNNIPPFKMVTGNPAEVVRDVKDLDKKYLEKNPEIYTWYKEWQKTH